MNLQSTGFSKIDSLFINNKPEEVWLQAVDIVMHINPSYDFSYTKTTFDDVVRIFNGEYPGYYPIKSLYHDLSHTLDVFICAVRLMHGVHLSGSPLTDKEMSMIMIAALMHDIGYAQRHGDETGTGAKYTIEHVDRGIELMKHYIVDRYFPSAFALPLELIMHSTDDAVCVAEIDFPDERIRLLGQIVRTADFTAQMASRTYLEKLLFLYLEFEEAQIGNYKNAEDLLRKTQQFYAVTQQKLDGELGGVYLKLVFHFKEIYGEERNYYMESIKKNLAYLSNITSLNESSILSQLKREGIVEKARLYSYQNGS